jgi:hypothetical protein
MYDEVVIIEYMSRPERHDLIGIQMMMMDE